MIGKARQIVKFPGQAAIIARQSRIARMMVPSRLANLKGSS